MNAAQIIRRALLDIDAVNQDGTTHRLFTQAELLAWANDGKDRVEKALRQVNQDFGLRFRSSTDSAFRYDGQNYTPSSFQFAADTRTLTLPPDLLELRTIRPLTTGQEDRKFKHLDISDPFFRALEAVTNPQEDTIYWDVVAERTLRIANPPNESIDVELGYIARSRYLQLYTTGTIAITQDTATVTGSSTLWVDDEVNAFAEIIVAAAAAAPKVASQTSGGTFVDPSRFYNRISTIDSDTSLTLLGNWLTATVAAGTGYMIATIPEFIPPEHHPSIADYVAYRALKKAKSVAQATFKSEYSEGIKEMQSSAAERQSADPEFVEDYEISL